MKNPLWRSFLTQTENNSLNAIKCIDIHKSFGNLAALKGINLEVKKGTILGLLGPNGAGKTTLVRILTTILKPDQGNAFIMGYDIQKQARKVRTLLGLAGQYAAVDENLTGYENLKMIGKLSHLSSKAAAKKANELLELFDLTYAKSRVVKTYSGGMRRRLDLAASLVNNPSVLFLDEPTTGLDPQSRLDLWQMIKRLVEDGTTLLLTTQYLEEADKLADQIVVIDRGQIIASGTPSELKTLIGARVLSISFETITEAKLAYDILQKTTIRDLHLKNNEIEAPIGLAAQELSFILSALQNAQLSPTTLSIHEPSLDDVFLELTRKDKPRE
jgi:ABC-2 type transport system ATP-binding protein